MPVPMPLFLGDYLGNILNYICYVYIAYNFVVKVNLEYLNSSWIRVEL